jgi:predicted XRE-type DNA-binding protein
MPTVLDDAEIDDTSVTVGSGNVFADIGVADPETALKKARLAARIADVIEARGWTQVQAAEQMGIDQPKVSAVLRGRLSAFSIERLLGYLRRLGQGVEFRFTGKLTGSAEPRPKQRPRAKANIVRKFTAKTAKGKVARRKARRSKAKAGT